MVVVESGANRPIGTVHFDQAVGVTIAPDKCHSRDANIKAPPELIVIVVFSVQLTTPLVAPCGSPKPVQMVPS